MTLVEVLAVIGVLGALLGIALPTIGGAREAAREAACGANIRSIQAANEAYALDHQERYVPGAAARRLGQTGQVVTNLERWHGARDAVSQPFRAVGGAITAYLSGAGSSRGVRECPSFAARLNELRERGEGFEAGAGGYGYNNSFVGTERVLAANGLWVTVSGGLGRAARRGQFAAPAQTIGFTDAAFAADTSVIEYSFAEPAFWPDMAGARPDPSIHFRHRGRAQVVWLDGRVSSEERTFTAWSGLYGTDPERVGIGWFGPQTNEWFDYE